MADMLHREAVYLWYYFSVQLEQIFKYWVLGMVLGSLVSVFLKDRIHSAFRFMGEKRLGICIRDCLASLYVRDNSYCRIFFKKRNDVGWNPPG